MEFFGEEHMDESLLIAFAAFEEQCKEVCLLNTPGLHQTGSLMSLFSTPNSMSEHGLFTSMG